MNTATGRSEPAIKRTTGRDREEWFEALDAWGAVGRPYREIFAWLTTEHGLSDWWAQKIIVEYEQARGVRDPGSRGDGTYTVTASKSIAAPAERVYQAVVDPDIRARWLLDVALRERTSRPSRSARFDCGDEGERVNVTIDSTGESRCQIGVEHARLASTHAADPAKAAWRDRLAALKTLLETEPPR